MGNSKRKDLTDEEIMELIQNPYVVRATKRFIYYTPEFRAYFVKEYVAGVGPTLIFRNAGIRPEILGPKRIERYAAHIRERVMTDEQREGAKKSQDLLRSGMTISLNPDR